MKEVHRFAKVEDMDETDRVNALMRRVTDLERKLELVVQHVGLKIQDDPLPHGLAEAAVFLREGNKLAAIDVYRRLTGADLRAAKVAVDALDQKLYPERAQR
jgi:ribosomal protein L7/L12